MNDTMEANSAKLRSLIALFVLAGIFPTFGLGEVLITKCFLLSTVAQ